MSIPEVGWRLAKAISMIAGRALLKVLSVKEVRRFIYAVLVWKGLQAIVDYLVFCLKVEAANLLIGKQSNEREIAAFLAFNRKTVTDYRKMSLHEQMDLVDAYMPHRIQATEADVIGQILLG